MDINILEKFPALALLDVVYLILLTLMRLIPVIAMVPFLGSKVSPAIVKIGLALSLSIIFIPFLATNTDPTIPFGKAVLLYSAKELIIGTIIGFLFAIPFYIVQSSGIIVDYMRGASSMQAQDPSMHTQTSSIGILYNTIFIVIFFSINGPLFTFETIAQSYAIFPTFSTLDSTVFSPTSPLWPVLTKSIQHVANLSIQLAAPPIIAILMTEMFLGIANRLAPQIQISFLGMSLKSLIGITVLWLSWSFILKQCALHTTKWMSMIESMLTLPHHAP